MHTFYSSWSDLHKDYGNDIRQAFTYEKFKNSWYAYLKLLDIDYQTGFTCPSCSPGGGDDTPEILICDGTSVSFQRRMWAWRDFGDLQNSNKIPQTR